MNQDLVTMDYDGRVCCPFHGPLDASTEYAPGVAPCGCMFCSGRGGLVRAQRASGIDETSSAKSIGFAAMLQDDGKNAG